MRKTWLAIGLAVCVGTTALAQESDEVLRCERFANGSFVTDVYSYPSFVLFDTYIFNDSTSETLVVNSIWDWPNREAPSLVNIPVDPGSSIGGTTFFRLESYEQCASLADRENRAEDGKPVRLKTFTEVTTSSGAKAKCVARVVCH